MNLFKKTGLHIYHHACVRKNLFHLRDTRAFLPIIERKLFEAAKVWPQVLPFKPQTIIDAGAYSGEIAEQFSLLYRPKFIALVEPLPDMVRQLQTRCFAPDQRIFNCALGRKEGKEILNILANLTSSSILEVTPESRSLFNRPMNKIDSLQVAIRTLDSVFKQCDLDDLDLLKVDVQGYEMEVFLGGIETLKKTRLVVTEVLFFEHYKGAPLFGEIYDFLYNLGFRLRNTFEYIYDSKGIPLQCNAVFINCKML